MRGGGGELQGRRGVLGLGAAGGGLLDPADDLAVGVGLQRLEGERVGLGQRPDADLELVELAGGDAGAGGAVQVIRWTTSVTGSPKASSGFGGVPLVSCAVQPGCGLTRTEAIGVSAGKAISILVVATSFSVGTRKVSLVKPPWVAPGPWTVTCADAGPARGGEQGGACGGDEQSAGAHGEFL